MKNEFTIEDTNFSKGIAICLMLIHHLFYENYLYVSDIYIHGHQLSNIISYYSKVCVAIFVILSGYGLNECSKKREITILNFYKNYILKLYINYWFIWICFVPISVFFFNQSFEQVYGKHYIIKLIINLLGLQNYFGFYGYNPTWWFISAIILLYIIFPFLKTLIDTYKEYFLSACFILLFAYVNIWGIDISSTLNDWIFPFALGIYLSSKNAFVGIKNYKLKNKYIKAVLYGLLILFIAFWRKFGIMLIDTKIDSVFGLLIIMIGYEYLSKNIILNKSINFLGKHSSNIFLLHTFIYLEFFRDYIYWFKYPIIIFFVLLLISLILSIIVEELKEILFINKLYKKFTISSSNNSIVIQTK